jgi:hypothetical protein
MKMKYQTCEARIQDEFPNATDSNGRPMCGTITQVELYNPHDSSEVVAWFTDERLAEKVCRLLNKSK